MNPEDGILDPEMMAPLAPIDPHLAAAMTAIVLALVAAVLLLLLLNQDEVRR